MNSLARTILRGLLSGEIKADPQVFDQLRLLSDRQLQGHSRILRLVRPVASQVVSSDRLPFHGSGQDKPPCGVPRVTHEAPAPGPPGLRGDAPAFAKVPFGRWIRVRSCLLVAGGMVGFGSTAAHAGLMVAAHPHSASGVTETVFEILSALQPFPQTLVFSGGLLLVCWLLVLGTQWYCRTRLFVMKPHEVALDQLDAAHYRARRDETWSYPEAVRSILQRYVYAQLGLRASGAGREDSLREWVRQGGPLTGYHKLLLGELLDALAPDSSVTQEIHQRATAFIWATACYRSSRGGGGRILVGTIGALPARGELRTAKSA